REEVRRRLRQPYWDRTLQIRNALKLGASVEEIADVTKVDPWFIYQINDIVELEKAIRMAGALHNIDRDFLLKIKQYGFSDSQIAYLLDGNVTEDDVREYRKRLGVLPTYQLVDTCAAEFPAQTPYYYSSYE